MIEIERSRAGEIRDIRHSRDWRNDRGRARGHHNTFRLEHLITDLDPGAFDARRSFDIRDGVVCRQDVAVFRFAQRCNEVILLRDEFAPTLECAPAANAGKARGCFGLVERFCRSNECLRWHAADVHAGPANCPMTNERYLSAEFSRPDGSREPGRACADNDQVETGAVTRVGAGTTFTHDKFLCVGVVGDRRLFAAANQGVDRNANEDHQRREQHIVEPPHDRRKSNHADQHHKHRRETAHGGMTVPMTPTRSSFWLLMARLRLRAPGNSPPSDEIVRRRRAR